jgi:hypothetical protein
MTARLNCTIRAVTACCALLLFLSGANGQLRSNASTHWAYSAYFGSGWYQVSEDRDVFVLRTTPRWALREPEFEADGRRAFGIDFNLAITVGLDKIDFDDIIGTADPDNVTTLSVTPGVDITIPINERWEIRPFVSLGWGALFDRSDSAWSYWTGVKSRYTSQNRKLRWALVNSAAYVGYTPSEGPADSFSPLMAGLEFDYPFGSRKLDDEQLYVSWYGTYTSFAKKLDLIAAGSLIIPVTDEWEFGLSLRKNDNRIKIWWFGFDRLGLAYRFSTSGDLKGISFVFRSVFDR